MALVSLFKSVNQVGKAESPTFPQRMDLFRSDLWFRRQTIEDSGSRPGYGDHKQHFGGLLDRVV
jgi:hypothetical protein